jgi:putative oxidoreductase
MKPIISSKIAATIYALAIGIFGVLHFIHANEMKSGVPDYIPGGIFWIYITGAGMILAAIAIIINKMTRLACYLLAAMFLIFVFTLHLKHLADGNFNNVLKDTAMAMAAILIGNSADA